MIGILAFAFLVVPLLELAVIVAAGESIGYLPTFALLIALSIAGAVLAKREGTAVWRRFTQAIKRGEVPSAEVADGFLVLLGGALLLTPGFLTDILGLLALLPWTRSVFKRWLIIASKAALARRSAKGLRRSR